jgi:phosphoribosylglycinamide formyltransferase-1
MTPEPAAILISGRGSNMVAILERAKAGGWLDAIAVVASNRPDAAGLARAEASGVPTAVLDHRPYGKERRSDFDADLAALLGARGVRWVVLAGFLRILGPRFLAPFEGRVINIHPSLLPAFPGLHTHERALAAGADRHGCTVHLVDRSLDGGPLLAQAEVPVRPDDDAEALAARVLEQEHRLLPAVVESALFGRLPREFPPRPQAAVPGSA